MRIRSVHPGQWTDEDFVSLSPYARLLAIALRNECDDQGLFQWKPLGLKMRLFPADNVDVAVLLAEMQAVDMCCMYEVGGRKYGAVRNFRKFQRPKKANAVHPLPDELRIYVGLEPVSTEPDADKPPPVPHQFPTSGEKSPQMEGEGGRREGEGGSSDANASVVAPAGSTVDEIQAAFDCWNDLAEKEGLPVADVLSKTRIAKLKARLRDCNGLDGWRAACERVRDGPHLLGDNERGWRASLDFMLQESSFIKVREGQYDRKGQRNGRNQNSPDDTAKRIAALADEFVN